MQDFACKILHGFAGPPHTTGILSLPAIIPFLHIFGIISTHPGPYPALCPTAYYILWLPPPAGHPATTHTPPPPPPGGASLTPAEELPPSKISLPNCPPNTPLLCLNLSPISVLVALIPAYPSNIHSLTQLFTPYTPFYQFPICPAPYPTLSYFCSFLLHF